MQSLCDKKYWYGILGWYTIRTTIHSSILQNSILIEIKVSYVEFCQKNVYFGVYVWEYKNGYYLKNNPLRNGQKNWKS